MWLVGRGAGGGWGQEKVGQGQLLQRMPQQVSLSNLTSPRPPPPPPSLGPGLSDLSIECYEREGERQRCVFPINLHTHILQATKCGSSIVIFGLRLWTPTAAIICSHHKLRLLQVRIS